MLVHICCSVDSHYFLQKIQEDYPDEKIVGYFYDPNIHPYSEYRLRLFDVQYSCDKLGIELIEGEYDYNSWLNSVKGYENAPEKGDRCTICFDKRLTNTALKALELGHNKFTTTLLISPQKSQEKLKIIGEKLSLQYNCEFVFKDYRSGKGMELQSKEVKQNHIYRQNYCGCMFGLIPQREQQKIIANELFSPVNQQILPNSIEERLELYAQRNNLIEQNIPFELVTNRFLNYRILSGSVKLQKKVIPSYFIAYSTLRNKKTKGKITNIINNIGYLNKDETKIISLDIFNKLSGYSFSSVSELYFAKIDFQKELTIRAKISLNSYDLSCIIVLDKFPTQNIEIQLDTTTYYDSCKIILKNYIL